MSNLDNSGQKVATTKTIVRYFKNGVLKFNDPNQYATGCLVEAIFLDKEGKETSRRYYGTVDKNGNVIDCITKDLGIALEEIGIYKIYFKGEGMYMLEKYEGGEVEIPYYEIFEARSVRGLLSSVSPTRMELDYENSQIKFYKDDVLTIQIGIDAYLDYLGLFLQNLSLLNIVNNYDESIHGLRDMINFRSHLKIKNITSNDEIYTNGDILLELDATQEDGNAQIADVDYGALNVNMNDLIESANNVGVRVCYHYSINNLIYSLFCFNNKPSFHRGKLGVGDGKLNPAQDIDVKANINADGAFMQNGVNTGITQNIAFKDVTEATHNVTIKGGIITSWTTVAP